MKLKLAQDLVARARRLFPGSAPGFEQARDLVRRQSWQAASRCHRLGQTSTVQIEAILREFVAFFTVILVNEFAIRLGYKSDAELKIIYDEATDYPCHNAESDQQQALIARLVRGERSGFDHWFYGYWNGDLDGMRIAPSDFAELKQIRIPGPTGIKSTDAGLILLVRVARLGSGTESLPELSKVLEYDTVIRQEVADYLRGLNELLRQSRGS